MTSLICKVQRLYLGDEKRTLIKEGEQFEVDEKTAAVYVKGGIAMGIGKPTPAPAPAKQPEKEDPDEAVPAEGAEKATDSGRKRR